MINIFVNPSNFSSNNRLLAIVTNFSIYYQDNTSVTVIMTPNLSFQEVLFTIGFVNYSILTNQIIQNINDSYILNRYNYYTADEIDSSKWL
jgi:hypothetical protein